MSYSLRDVTDDGKGLFRVTTSRAMHHILKLLVSAGFTGLFIAILGANHILAAGVIGGPVTYLVAKQFFWPWSKFRLTYSHACDMLTDGALALVSLAGAYLAIRDYWHAGVLLAGCVVAYLACHREARP